MLALTHSPALAGLVTAARLLPYLLLSLPAGVLVDRWNRKTVMIRCDVVRWLALGSVPLAFALGRLTLAQLFLVALVEGGAYVFFSLAQISSLPQVVAPAHLPRAYALSETADSLGTLAGPGLGGLIIGLARTVAAGAVLAYLADSLSYLVSVLSLRFIRAPFQVARAPAERRSLRAEIAVGLRFLWAERRLRLMALLTMTVNFLFAPLDLAIIVLGRDTLHFSVPTLGLIFSAAGVGGLLGSLVAPQLRARVSFGRVVLGSLVVWGAGAAVLAFAAAPVPLIVGRALLSATWPVYAVTLVSYRLTLTPDHLQGRVNSAFRLLSFGSEPLGAAIGGVLLGTIGPRPVFWLFALGLAACALVVGLSDLRRA